MNKALLKCLGNTYQIVCARLERLEEVAGGHTHHPGMESGGAFFFRLAG